MLCCGLGFRANTSLPLYTDQMMYHVRDMSLLAVTDISGVNRVTDILSHRSLISDHNHTRIYSLESRSSIGFVVKKLAYGLLDLEVEDESLLG